MWWFVFVKYGWTGYWCVWTVYVRHKWVSQKSKLFESAFITTATPNDEIWSYLFTSSTIMWWRSVTKCACLARKQNTPDEVRFVITKDWCNIYRQQQVRCVSYSNSDTTVSSYAVIIDAARHTVSNYNTSSSIAPTAAQSAADGRLLPSCLDVCPRRFSEVNVVPRLPPPLSFRFMADVNILCTSFAVIKSKLQTAVCKLVAE